MQQLVYISSARLGTGPAELAEILASSRRNNRRDGITGLLLHDGKRFLQVLEGIRPLVDAAFLRIKADPRHRATVILGVQPIEARSFGQWDMACETVGRVDRGRTLAETVDRMVGCASDPSLRAIFRRLAQSTERRAA